MSRYELRKNLFSFDPSQLGKVYRVQVADDYLGIWQAMQSHFERPHPGLPTHALEDLLAIRSGGPVKVAARPQDDGGVSAILMLRPLPVESINEVLQLWMLEALKSLGASVEDIDAELKITQLIALDAASLVIPGDLSSLAYHAIPWLVGQAMCSAPLQLSNEVLLRQTADGSLLTWDHPVLAESGKKTYSALHTITPQLVLLRDSPKPYIQLRARFVQSMNNWAAGKKKHAWVDTGQILIKAKLRTRFIEGSFETAYDFATSKLLTFLGHPGLPEIINGDIPIDSPVRPIYAVLPSSPVIGTGVGPLFLDSLGFHLMKTLPGTAPLITRKAVSMLRTADQGEPSPQGAHQIAVLAAHSALMLRLNSASTILQEGELFFKHICAPTITLTQLTPPDVAAMLGGQRSAGEVTRWLAEHVIPEVNRSGAKIVVVETSKEAADSKPEQDPKHLIRRCLAQHGLVTQFIMHLEAPSPEAKTPGRKKKDDERDFKALNTLAESIRLSGYFPNTFPKAKSVPNGTTVLSIYLDQLTQPGHARYLPVITRTTAGSQSAEIFWAAPDDQIGRWYSFSQGVSAIHSAVSLHTPERVKQLVSQALLSPTSTPNAPLIICADSKLRTFYGALKDSPGQGLPPLPKGAALLRIRADSHVAQITGDHSKYPSEPKFIGTRLGLYQSMESASVFYFVSCSNQYLALRSHRHKTRYDVDSRALRDFWQQLGVTEIAVIDPGAVASPNAVVEQVALLCRNAPLWDGQLRLPSPMHLGAQIASDHPLVEMKRKADANRVG